MATRPEPPLGTDSPDELVENVTQYREAWLTYLRDLTGYTTQLEETIQSQTESTARLRVRTGILEKEGQEFKRETVMQSGMISELRTQLREQMKQITLRIERDQAIAQATPVVNTPVTTITPPAKAFLDATARASPVTPPQSTSSSRLSERLPDPAIFEGDRKDFRRFEAKIHQKLKTNADRFPTAAERMSYVTNRLEGPAYAQILPYILDGECKLSNYPNILYILNRVYGDLNRIYNTRCHGFVPSVDEVTLG